MLSATPWNSCDSGYKGCSPAPAAGQSSSGFLFFSLILCQPSSKLGPPHLQYCQASTPHLVPSLESFSLKLGFAATVSHCICSRSVLLFPWLASFLLVSLALLPGQFSCSLGSLLSFPLMFLLHSLCFLWAGKLFHLSGLAWALVDQRGVLASFPFV